MSKAAKKAAKKAGQTRAQRRAAAKEAKASANTVGKHEQAIKKSLIEPPPAPPGSQVTDTAEVVGDHALQIIDQRSSRPVNVFIVDNGVRSFDPAADPRLVFVEGPVQSEILSAERARGKFARKDSGTLIYNHGGFDDVPNPQFPLVDILVLMDELKR